MKKEELKEFMCFKKEGQIKKPLFVVLINGSFIIAVYQGSLSKYDILIKYRQKIDGKWSRIRTPKHIHWAVDVLIKMHFENKKTKDFLDFLIKIWEDTTPFKNEQEREDFLNIEKLIEANKQEIERYEELSQRGEYSIKFLVLLARLLMAQEKTNLESAYMFKKLLDALKSGKDIFGIVSIATYR